MKGGGYSMKAVADLSSKSSVDRERLREREREARAQMTFEADQRASQDVINSAPLFGEIVRVNPKSNDKERQQIERKLGRFEDVKHLLADQDVTNLFGVDGQPPPSPAPNISSGSSSSSSTAGHEFKKPNACLQSHPTKSSHHHHHHHHHHHSGAQRNAFAKPSDGKLGYANRGSSYTTPSTKHVNTSVNQTSTLSAKAGGALSANNSSLGSGGGGGNGNGSSSSNINIHNSSNSNNNNSLASTNYHYGSMSNKIHDYAVRIQQSAAKNLPRINCELRDSLRGMSFTDDNTSVSLTNVENILDEMTSGVRTPLTAIAATPRKEVESKFTFNPISGKVESLLPMPRMAIDKGNKCNATNNVLGSTGSGGGGGRNSFISPVFRNDDTMPFSSTSLSVASVSKNVGGGYAYSTSANDMISSPASKEKIDSTALPCLKSDLSLSEDTDEGDGVENGNDCDDEDDDEEEEEEEDEDDGNEEEEDDENMKNGSREQRQLLPQRSRGNATDEKENNKLHVMQCKAMGGASFASKKELSSSSSSADPAKTEELRKCEAAVSEGRNTSSSDDSDSDSGSGSESEDSSSDSPSPPSLRLPVVAEQEESKHRWNLKNFLPPSAHENSTPASTHNSQARRRQNCEKPKANDSDSSVGSARRNTRLASCSTSDSDNGNRHRNGSVRSSASSRKRAIDSNTKAGSNKGLGSGNVNAGPVSVGGGNVSATDDAVGSNDVDNRRKCRLRSSSYSQSSDDDSDRASPYAGANTMRNNSGGSNLNGITVGSGGCSSGISGNGNNSSCSTSVGCASLVANSLSCANNFASNGGGASGNGCAATSGNVTVVGVVRPHQRKPPSPQIFHLGARGRSSAGMRDSSPTAVTNDERYSAFVQQQQQQQQRSLHLTSASGNAPESQCDLSAGQRMNRALINDRYQHARNSTTSVGNGGSSKNCSSNSNNNDNNNVSSLAGSTHASVVASGSRVAGGNLKVAMLQSNDKSTLQTNKTSVSSKVRRKSKSPALASSNESPAKKKRGRKRTIKVPELSDSDEDTPKTKAAPEKKRPGRPPLKRNDTDDLDWNYNSRRKMTDKFPSSANVWCDRERRRSSLRMSSFTTVDSDSEIEIPSATVKPTARVIPAVKRKDGGGGGSGSSSVRNNRDSSCESMRNDSGDFNAISDSIKNMGGSCGIVKALESPPKLDVECIAVQDKKKSDTLRKLFSRREEGGGKTGGKGKGGKGKCGVIVMESEVERKLLQRSSVVSPASPSSNLPQMQNGVLDMTPHAAISSPSLQSNDDVTNKYSEPAIKNSGGGSSSSNNNNQHHHHHHHHHHHVQHQYLNHHHRQQQQQQQHHHHNHSLDSHHELSGYNDNIGGAGAGGGGGGGGNGNGNNSCIDGMSQVDAAVDMFPKLTYNEAGKPSLMCKIDLSRIPYIVAKKRSEEIRIKSELADTRQTTNNVQDGSGGAVAVITLDASSTNTTSNVPLIEPVSDRRRHDNVKDVAASMMTAENSDLHRDQNRQLHEKSQPPTLTRPRKKHASKKTRSGKRKHYADEARDVTMAAASPAAAAEDDDGTSIFANASTVHTPSVDTTDMDSALSSDSDTRKVARCANQNAKKSLAVHDSSHATDSSIPSNMISSCYAVTLNDVQHHENAGAVAGQSSADDESWDSSESSCSNCSASSTPCHDSVDKYSKNGKRSSRYRSCGGGGVKSKKKKKKKKKLRNEQSPRCSTSLGDCAGSIGGGGDGGGGGVGDHLPNTSHERSIMTETPTTTTFNGYHPVVIGDLVRPTVPTHHGIYYSYLEHKASEDLNSESDNVSPNLYLMEAKRLKHAADTERDSVAQGMQYLEAILSFVLTGHVLERKNQMDTAFNMYSETLKLIVYISKKFRTLCTNAAQSSIPNKIAILSLRCESILNLKLYTMRENEVKEVHNAVAEYFNKHVAAEACLISNAAGVPSPHSPTPSPASSVGSNSSGYSTGDRRSVAMSQCIAVPFNLHVALQKQHNFYSNLIASFSYWEEADKLIFSGGNKDFFVELDRFCGPLTLHSSLKDLVHYVRVGIQRLKAIISHNHGV